MEARSELLLGTSDTFVTKENVQQLTGDLVWQPDIVDMEGYSFYSVMAYYMRDGIVLRVVSDNIEESHKWGDHEFEDLSDKLVEAALDIVEKVG